MSVFAVVLDEPNPDVAARIQGQYPGPLQSFTSRTLWEPSVETQYFASLRCYGERLARLEARMDFLATKEEIQKIKVWVLSGVLGGIVAGMGLAAGLAVVVVRVLFS